jgi:5-oxopent-3-ene-1,2,5-tricarboxylate decarboxylase/2-hydroxyhepta-2,4-diene-1,7-dioate isomerase
VAGLVVVADLSVPHDSFYRPSVRHKARDGFCPIGPQVWPSAPWPRWTTLAVSVSVDGQVVHNTTTGDRFRHGRATAGRRQRLHDAGARRRADAGRVGRRTAVAAGHTVAIDVAGPGHAVVHAGAGGRMRTARVAYAGAIHTAVPHAQGLQLADGRVLAEDEVVWLPPWPSPAPSSRWA